MELGYTGEIYLKSLRRTILRNQLFKVTNKGKPPPMFSLAWNLIKNNAEYLPIGISLKKVRVSNVGFFNQRNYIKKSKRKQRGFFSQRNYVGKSTCERRGNSPKFGF